MPHAGATSSGTGGVGGSGGTNAGTAGVSAGTGGAIAESGGSSSVEGGSGGKSQTGGSGGKSQTGGSGGVASAGRGGSSGGSAVGDCAPPASYANLFVTVSGKTQADSDQKVATAWSTLFNPSGGGTIYFNGPGADESYVKDIYNGDVRTEGMSYGMITAVQLNHQTEFDRLWTWVKNHMANGTGEIRWSCKTSGSGCAGGGAPDGEEYFATALIFASHRWGDSTGTTKIAYSTEAKWVLDLIRTKYFNSQYHLVKFGSNSNNVDPSYVLPAFYKVWACFDTENAAFWTEAVTAGRQYMQKVVDGNGVCPYQASFTATNPQAANSDSTRCVVNLMMDWYLNGEDSWQKDTYAPKFGSYSSSRNNGGAAVGCNSTLGFALPASSGKPFVDKLWSTGVPSSNYWDGVLYMLGMLHVSGNFRIW
ncbi:MAG TPA: glycosyl hydrolase family 8 [Polyangiaceae bacterium]|nr:glycosyl hydrolase family 8 [Polyangiaceae bacterium]